jgi:hypothetical protein
VPFGRDEEQNTSTKTEKHAIGRGVLQNNKGTYGVQMLCLCGFNSPVIRYSKGMILL